jgi:hypothetical protein
MNEDGGEFGLGNRIGAAPALSNQIGNAQQLSDQVERKIANLQCGENKKSKKLFEGTHLRDLPARNCGKSR